jgi:hypothetical protein
MSVDQITASRFLDLKDKAKRNGADKPAFRLILEELNGLPITQEQLSFEFLTMALNDLGRGNCPRAMLVESLYFERSVSKAKLVEFLEHIEAIASGSFELLKSPTIHSGERMCLEMALGSALILLRKRDGNRFKALLDSLKMSIIAPNQDPRSKFLDRIVELKPSS